MDRVVRVHLGHLLAVDGLAHDVPDATERALAHRHLHRGTRVDDLEAALQTVGGSHGDAAHDIARQLALDLEDGVDVADGRVHVDGEGVVDVRHAALELNVHDGADDARDAPDARGGRGVHSDGICH